LSIVDVFSPFHPYEKLEHRNIVSSRYTDDSLGADVVSITGRFDADDELKDSAVGNSSKIKSKSSIEASTGLRYIPNLPMIVHKSLYWRVSEVCFTLGCARPDTIGRFLWKYVPNVHALMLMAISSRFHHNNSPNSFQFSNSNVNQIDFTSLSKSVSSNNATAAVDASLSTLKEEKEEV
jgi:hypothetical protein